MQWSDVPIRHDPRVPGLRPAIADALPDTRNGAGSNTDVRRSRRGVEPDAERLTFREPSYVGYLVGYLVGRDTVRRDCQVCLVIDRLPRRLEIPDAHQRVRARQQRALYRRSAVCRMPLQPGEDRLRARV